MRRLGFAVLLAVASTVFAECTITNDSILGNAGWAVAIMIPLYGLHALVLGRLAFRRGTPAFPTLFCCGMLFGLYEAYITKVLWTGWDDKDPAKIAGVSVVALLVLVPWWHAFMAFMLPLVFVERYALGWRERTALLPARMREWMSDLRRARWTWAVIGLFLGMYQSAAGFSKPLAPFVGFGDLLLMLALVSAWRPREGETLQTMLPSGKGLAVAVAWLAGIYGISIAFFRPEKTPGFGPQFAVWVLYGVIGWLLFRSFRPSALPEEGEHHARVPVLREAWPFPLVWFGTALLARQVPALPTIAFLACSLAGVVLGLWSVGRTVRATRGLQAR